MCSSLPIRQAPAIGRCSGCASAAVEDVLVLVVLGVQGVFVVLEVLVVLGVQVVFVVLEVQVVQHLAAIQLLGGGGIRLSLAESLAGLQARPQLLHVLGLHESGVEMIEMMMKLSRTLVLSYMLPRATSHNMSSPVLFLLLVEQ